ncbi:MAG: N-6 DNA methylase, partial [Clostridia bacterium]|nr:N-6 DNA methylase [Clostridia bacterium]
DGAVIGLSEVCRLLSISSATGRNWVRLGKITPIKEKGGEPLFLRSHIEEVLKTLSDGKSKALNRRRNKKMVNKISLYETYISHEGNIDVVNGIIENYSGLINPLMIRSILANFALQLACQKKQIKTQGKNLIAKYMGGGLCVPGFTQLVDDLIGDKGVVTDEIDLELPVFEEQVKYIEDEDTLGFVYISLSNLGQRKTKGAYYTPLSIVKKSVSHLRDLTDIQNKTIFDPCCGSGNFLLDIGKYMSTPRTIYGQDIDPIAICLARISFAIKFDIADLDFLYSHFVCADTFDSWPVGPVDIIIGNPPWGGEIPRDQRKRLSARLKTAKKRSIETFSLFTEHALGLLSDKGVLAFVLPETILNVKSHREIRSILIEKCNFKFIHYLGEAFSDVQCPSIILGVEKSKRKVNGVPKILVDDDCYSISSNRQMSEERLNFRVKDSVQDCLDSIENAAGVTTLQDNAKFALGIVTGDNAAHISDICHPGYEPVLRGSDIRKFRLIQSEKYIKFTPAKFQQVAPTELYRAPEKLFYRFICNALVFAYDDRQMLSLNSCNILIPEIPEVQVKYVMAILNSRVASFYFMNMFNSVKVLRSHIEQLPIYIGSEKEQQEVINMVDKIISSKRDVSAMYDQLDEYIISLYRLTSKEQGLILDNLSSHNLFLP